MLKIKNLIISQIVITLFFIIGYTTDFFGITINYFLPCTPIASSSIFFSAITCYWIYDIYLVLVTTVLFIINMILLIISLIKNKNVKN